MLRPPPVPAVLLLCTLTLNSACSSMKTIDPVTSPSAAPFGDVKAGDTVLVELNSGARWRFKVHAVEGEHLVGDNNSRVARSEIARLQRKSFSGPKTAGLVAGIVAALLFVMDDASAPAPGDIMAR